MPTERVGIVEYRVGIGTSNEDYIVKVIVRVLNAGVEITTRQLAKCKWNLELASIF
jgi:hypothetical protein